MWLHRSGKKQKKVALKIKMILVGGVLDVFWIWIFSWNKHKDREFVLKFSAMEIYNEAVRDLLSADGTPLRLLDDPEVNYAILWPFVFLSSWYDISWMVKKSVEFNGTLRFCRKGLLSRNLPRRFWGIKNICRSFLLYVKVKALMLYFILLADALCNASFSDYRNIFLALILNFFSAQRKIGETSLNETSSRSHQILRLVSFYLVIKLSLWILGCCDSYLYFQ